MQLTIGTMVALHGTSGGKLFLSLLPKELLSSLIGDFNLEQKTLNTLTYIKKLEKALRKIRKNKLEQITRDLLRA